MPSSTQGSPGEELDTRSVTSEQSQPSGHPEAGSSRQSRKDQHESLKTKFLKHQIKSPFKFLGKSYCGGCKKKCTGKVLRVNDEYFHTQCFKCFKCSTPLPSGGFLTKDSQYYCSNCYQTNFGTKCFKCSEYVEGEVVSALGNTYHQKCFTCARCQKPFPTGERVTFVGKKCFCQNCIKEEKKIEAAAKASGKDHITGVGKSVTSSAINVSDIDMTDKCAWCLQELKDGQALAALDKQYHIWCFKCTICGVLLHGEYMGHEGKPYCEKDYHERYGVKCAYCQRFIAGKVLQAGDNNHFHPTCARCSKCGDPFGDGEEMYLQGAAIWHPRCGPGPGESGFVLNTYDTSSIVDGFDGLSSTMSELHYGSRASSPGGSLLREQWSLSPGIPFGYSYIREGRSVSSLRRPVEPYDRKTSHPPMHFHVPQSKHRKISIQTRSSSRSGMHHMVNNLAASSPRPRSPHMNNEEPIEMSHFPDGRKSGDGHVTPIERDDFPAPQFLYADPERRRRWSEPMKKEGDNNLDDESPPAPEDTIMQEKLKNQEETLRKISSKGSEIGKVFLNTVQQREKLQQQRKAFMDPRSFARTPSATREPVFGLRYDSPVKASPSRLTHYSRAEDRGLSQSTPGYGGTLNSAQTTPSYRIVSSFRGPPKPGYTAKKSSTLPSYGTASINGSFTPGNYSQFEAGLSNKTHSTDFSMRSDASEHSIDIPDSMMSTAINSRRDIKSSTTYTQGLKSATKEEEGGRTSVAYMNRSLPNMNACLQKAPKIYPIHLLLTTNYRLPKDVDRCNLENHLSDNDFELVFEQSRPEFYRLPQWRRNELKKRVKLF